MEPRKEITTDELRSLTREAALRFRQSEQDLCDYLAVIDQGHIWRLWGFGSLGDYVEKELEIPHRKALELIRVKASLEALPALRRAFREGQVPFSKIREATRVATPGTDAHWAKVVGEKTCREVEREVFAERRAATITLKVEMSAEEYDRLERALDAVRRRRGRRTPLAACLDEIATAFLTGVVAAEPAHTHVGTAPDGARATGPGPGAPQADTHAGTTADSGSATATAVGVPKVDTHVGTTTARQSPASQFPAGGVPAPFTQVIYRCEGCDKAEVETRRGLAQVSPEAQAMAACDSTVLRHGKRVRRTIPLPVARVVWTRARAACESCGQRGWLHLHHVVPVEHGGEHSVENLTLLCSACHAGEHRAGGRRAVAGQDGAAIAGGFVPEVAAGPGSASSEVAGSAP